MNDVARKHWFKATGIQFEYCTSRELSEHKIRKNLKYTRTFFFFFWIIYILLVFYVFSKLRTTTIVVTFLSNNNNNNNDWDFHIVRTCPRYNNFHTRFNLKFSVRIYKTFWKQKYPSKVSIIIINILTGNDV